MREQIRSDARREGGGFLSGGHPSLIYSGLVLLLVGLLTFGTMLRWLHTRGQPVPYSGDHEAGRIIVYYLGSYLPVVLMFGAAVVCAILGYALLNTAGATVVIPRQDRELLNDLRGSNAKVVSLYVKLHSLTGVTGFFTKIGITGLPLATITLSLIFTVFAVFAGSDTKLFDKLIDLATLTLGAFLGSYVQRDVSARERVLRLTPRIPTSTPAPTASHSEPHGA